VRVLVAQTVGQGEGVEDVVLAAGHPVALASACGDPRGDREDAVPAGLQSLDQQALGAFHADRQAGPQRGEFGVELVEACDVVAEADLPLPLSGGVTAQSWWWLAPQSMPTKTSSMPDLTVLHASHAPGPSRPVTSWPARWTLISVLEARLPLASTEPAAAGRDGSAAGPRGSRCQGPLPAAEVTDGNLPSSGDVSR
jgi:hypothetical protein